MKTILIIISIALVLFLVLFLYSACVISSQLSREEERREQNEFGRVYKE